MVKRRRLKKDEPKPNVAQIQQLRPNSERMGVCAHLCKARQVPTSLLLLTGRCPQLRQSKFRSSFTNEPGLPSEDISPTLNFALSAR